jgi:hypothetical protein
LTDTNFLFELTILIAAHIMPAVSASLDHGGSEGERFKVRCKSAGHQGKRNPSYCAGDNAA